MRRLYYAPISTVGIAVLASLSTACEDDLRPVVIAENLTPVARIEAPSRTGVGDLVRFDGTLSTDQDGRIDKHTWNFGQGSATASTSVAFNVYPDVGTYVVTLTVTDNRGATDTATHAIEISNLPDNQPPIAAIIAPAAGDPNQPVLFDGRTSSDPDGTIERYEWTLGAGGPAAQGPQVSHTFVMPGLYEVTLAVTDDRGARSTTTHSIDIGMPMGNRPPVANAGLDQQVGLGEAVMFDGSASFDPDGSVATHTWNFGDGAMATGAMATHTYNVESTYRVTLTVADDMGAMATDTTTITVGSVNFDGEYSMVANPNTTTCGGLPATFVATTISFATNGTMVTTTTPNPENPGGPPITLTGTMTGPNFSVSGTFVDSSGGEHNTSLVGSFSGTMYTANMTEAITFMSISLCTLNWALTGDKIQ